MQPQLSSPQTIPLSPLFASYQPRFDSVTAAVQRYRRLRELFASPRSIPLGLGKTHVARSDSHGSWQQLRQEFAALAVCFPRVETVEWHVLLMSVLNLMPWQRLDILEQITGERYSRWALSKAEDEASGRLAQRLREHGYLT